MAQNIFQLMEDKQTNLGLTADITHADQLLEIADLLGPELCLLKTHIDILEDFTPDLPQQLRKLALKHRFILFEDRKFADIGNTVKLQYEGGIYRIADWADVVNAHTLPGPGVIQGLAEAGRKKNRGLILLAEMSSKGNLMNAEYTQQTLQLAEQFADFVIGFITQHAVSTDPHWLNFTPAVKLDESNDKFGQQYVTPQTAVLENGSDIIIAGRGILQSDNILSTARLYREAGWESYLRRCER
jgi:uridine monophosphate synthetase